ncbi:MAG: Bug family tripartite tricarboxylate transporter substrate binding protein, partial [Advenella sp.]
MKRRDFMALLAATVGTGLAPAVGASLPENWPEKPVRMIVPFPAGGATDIIARILAANLERFLGQPFVVDNRAGASGIIGESAAARAAADGYTVLLTGNGPHAVNTGLFDPMPYDPLKDFAQISLTSILPLVLNVHPSVPATNLPEFVTWVQDNPGKFNYASPGVGSPPHLTMELFKHENNLDIVHVPYKGSSLAITDLIGGQITVMFDNALASFQHIKNGNVRALGVGSTERLSSLADVPTFKEAGFPQFEAYTWTALAAPAGVPESIMNKLADATAKTLKDAGVKERLTAQGAIAVSSTPAELEERVR